VNDYVSLYLGSKAKTQIVSGETWSLLFIGNNFEGCLRVEDGSEDDGNRWWTVMPVHECSTTKELLIWYDEELEFEQGWYYVSERMQDEDVPTDELENKPKILGGGD